ncbi:PACE efflux transporter [Craterilacuibacter sp.]|uniref:PACE efflux transporter n=1 Tax=Craterilacuibacter sp. TaxID=2870909 RepID=UPI003F3771B9
MKPSETDGILAAINTLIAKGKLTMRNTRDRLRHTIGFEVIGLLIASPLASWITGISLTHMGPMALFFSLLAAVWNYAYNLGVDKLLLKLQGHTYKNLMQRVLHAFGFEGGLMVLTLPVMAWWLGLSMQTALALNLGFVAFYLVYTFVYNWSYDQAFPIPSPQTA